jgi:hypothetical protein
LAELREPSNLLPLWYKNIEAAAEYSSEIEGATGTPYTPPTDVIGTIYYYVVVTNTKGAEVGQASTVFAPIQTLSSLPDIPAASATITVTTDTKYQYVTGFGGMSNVWVSPHLTANDIDTLELL